MPWNSPLLLMTWKLAPALAAGCTFVVKPAEQTPASTLEFAALVEEAGFPPGVFNVVTGFGADAGAPLVAHPGVDKVAFTGATATGKPSMKGAARAPGARHARTGRQVAEHRVRRRRPRRGGQRRRRRRSSPRPGQTCIAGSRLLVQDEVYDEVVDALAARARAIRLGDPLDAETEMGPVAFRAAPDKVEGCDRRGDGTRARGSCRRRRAGAPELRDGLFVEPTIFGRRRQRDADRARRDLRARAHRAALPDEDEACGSPTTRRYGLAAGVWTRDLQRAHRVAARSAPARSGSTPTAASAPMAPFGGYKQSGIGRENGLAAIGSTRRRRRCGSS